MKRIASFEVDHTSLQPGMYLSRVDGDIVTYDLRFVRPNTPPFLENAAMHTIEHLFATYVRNSRWGGHVVYFGPMGCRTGFYFLTRGLSHEEAIRLTQEGMEFIARFEGEVPGTTAAECGNWREHDLTAARKLAGEYRRSLTNWSPELLDYNHGKL